MIGQVKTRPVLQTASHVWYCFQYGCFRKWWYSQIIHFGRVFHFKPSILGYPYFLETPIYESGKTWNLFTLSPQPSNPPTPLHVHNWSPNLFIYFLLIQLSSWGYKPIIGKSVLVWVAHFVISQDWKTQAYQGYHIYAKDEAYENNEFIGNQKISVNVCIRKNNK